MPFAIMNAMRHTPLPNRRREVPITIAIRANRVLFERRTTTTDRRDDRFDDDYSTKKNERTRRRKENVKRETPKYDTTPTNSVADTPDPTSYRIPITSL
jgi:hypothetical protein